MASINFTQGKFESFLDSGAVNNGGDVAFFTADGTFSTPKTTYTTSALSTPNAHPKGLDSAGRATVFFEGDADVRIRDSLAATVYTQRNVNPSSVVTSHLFSVNTTLDGTHAEAMVEVTGATTLSLTAAATLGQGWRVNVKNSGTGAVTIARLAGGDKINGTASNITLPAGASVVIAVADAIDGFTTYGVNIGESLTFTAINNFTLAQFFTAGIGPGYIQNYSLAGTVGANALTITMSGYDGTALSSTNKSQFTYRSATAATGTTSTLSVTANTTLVISSGSTHGATSGVPFRLWILGINDGGTFRLGSILCSTSTNVFSISDDDIVSSTAEGGAGAADTAGVIYTGTAVTAKAMRVLGYFEFSLTTAGTWDEVPDKVQLWQPAMKLPGAEVQRVLEVNSAASNGATVLPVDDTIPQITEGVQVLTKSFTGKSSANKIEILASVSASTSLADVPHGIAVFDGASDALAAVATDLSNGAANRTGHFTITYYGQASTTLKTYSVRAGPPSAGTIYFNGSGATRNFGGVSSSTFIVREIMG